ncbi:hypothetical protein Dimus_012931 [Dionaea muscipula]
MEVIKRQKWEKLFKRRELVHVDAVKEFYAKLAMSHNRKKDVARSKVRGDEIVFDHLKLASILGIPGNNGLCEYIKEVWEESRYTKPLEITRKFANDETIMEARRVKSVEMKSFQRFIHFLVMKNVVPRFGKRDTDVAVKMATLLYLLLKLSLCLFSSISQDLHHLEESRQDDIATGAKDGKAAKVGAWRHPLSRRLILKTRLPLCLV